MNTFELTENHIKLLRNAYVSWDDCETGAPAIDPKRPYGNKYIAQDISALEFTDRIKLAEDTIVNADPEVLKTFNNFYGTLTNADLISYVLAPDETLPKLQTKAAAAQIGSAAAGE